MLGYLERLTLRLAQGLALVPAEIRGRHAAYLLAAQRADGGFAGREGGSDLYYTSFALRSLAILGELRGEPAERAGAFLRSRLTGRESVVDFTSLLFAGAQLHAAAGIDPFTKAAPNWRESVAEAFEKLRRPDGGYAKAAEGIAGSTYQTFLVLLCRELIGLPAPEPEKIVQFLLDRRTEEGGFLEIRVQKRAGVNPTAAAVAALQMLGAMNDAIRGDVIEFLLELRSEEGGFLANTRIPIADLLSTFTALLTLLDLGGSAEPQWREAMRFVQSLQREEGGFQAAAWDPAHDVEYTFYGLGCLALLKGERP